MNIVQAEENLKKIITKFSKESFIFDLMWAYDFPKATISKLKIKYKDHDDVVVPSKLHFVGVSKKELDSKFDELVKYYSTAKKAPRFIVVTDYQNIKAYDNKVAEKLDIEIKNLSKHPDFFLPWAGIDKKVFQMENPADVKAAEKLAKLFDIILKDNLKLVEKNRHSLNVFLTRILFCFFAEDTDIFKKGLFTESLASHTKTDGSDLDDYLQRLFEVLNKKSRAGLPDFLKEFPYVNGGLFAEKYPIPKFSKKSRESLIDLGSDLNWAEINPDIFGSMIQAVVHPDQRAGLGMHYTSVTNIMKVIEPLFLTELKEEFANADGNKNKLKKLLERIEKIKIFDPACGSGNFLIIAYKELRYLEMDILKILGGLPVSKIFLTNFYGIELDDFAHEVAKLSLWLAEHQMNVLFSRQLGGMQALLPLKDSGKIVCGNATQVTWESVCTNDGEIYILGNPPYLGARYQEESHKNDMAFALKQVPTANNLDYISCWFYKASQFILKSSGQTKCAFVSTNSLCQGGQVPDLWPYVLTDKVEIHFAHTSFKWSNNAKNKANVICIIIGLQKKSNVSKYLFTSGNIIKAKNINPYLVDYKTMYVDKRRTPLSNVPEISFGSMANDGGFLTLSPAEKKELLVKYPNAKKFIKPFLGAQEFINGIERWCIWVEDKDRDEAFQISDLKERFNKVKAYRNKSDRSATRKLSECPHRFAEIRYKDSESIIIPRTSSERRCYIPIGFLSKGTVVSDNGFTIYDANITLFAFLSSSMHMTWVKTIGGRLKSDYRYSADICYNTFPIPQITTDQEKKITNLALNVLSVRAKYSAKSLADLYDLDSMPEDLKVAHHDLDTMIDGCYSPKIIKSDIDRMEVLFKFFEELKGKNNE